MRLLSGGKFGINQVEVSPSGQYAAGADYGGTVHIWDLRNGRRVNELVCCPSSTKGASTASSSASMIHSMSYSPCGSTIATGGDDCIVRIWDARGLANNATNPEYALTQGWGNTEYGEGESPSMDYYPSDSRGTVESSSPSAVPSSLRSPLFLDQARRRNLPGMREPVKKFHTMKTMLLDLKYTKRNLLLGVGKYSATGPVGFSRISE